jgi:hypothetical protein
MNNNKEIKYKIVLKQLTRFKSVNIIKIKKSKIKLFINNKIIQKIINKKKISKGMIYYNIKIMKNLFIIINLSNFKLRIKK